MKHRASESITPAEILLAARDYNVRTYIVSDEPPWLGDVLRGSVEESRSAIRATNVDELPQTVKLKASPKELVAAMSLAQPERVVPALDVKRSYWSCGAQPKSEDICEGVGQCEL